MNLVDAFCVFVREGEMSLPRRLRHGVPRCVRLSRRLTRVELDCMQHALSPLMKWNFRRAGQECKFYCWLSTNSTKTRESVCTDRFGWKPGIIWAPLHFAWSPAAELRCFAHPSSSGCHPLLLRAATALEHHWVQLGCAFQPTAYGSSKVAQESRHSRAQRSRTDFGLAAKSERCCFPRLRWLHQFD